MFPFIGFGFGTFPLCWMSPCSSVAATWRAEHLLLTTVCFTGIRNTHAGLFLILPVSFIHLGVSAIPWTLSSLASPIPESLFLLSWMPWVWFLLCRASSHQAWIHAQRFSKALGPMVNFKLRTCWSAPLKKDQIIPVLKDKHLLKSFAEFRPKHTH